MSETFQQRLMRAIERIGKTEAERAKKLGYTTRAIDYWAEGKGLVPTLERLENAGVIHITGECTCIRQPAECPDVPA